MSTNTNEAAFAALLRELENEHAKIEAIKSEIQQRGDASVMDDFGHALEQLDDAPPPRCARAVRATPLSFRV